MIGKPRAFVELLVFFVLLGALFATHSRSADRFLIGLRIAFLIIGSYLLVRKWSGKPEEIGAQTKQSGITKLGKRISKWVQGE